MKRIAIIKMGHVDTIVNFKKILKWKSDIFTISSLTEKKILPNNGAENGYLDLTYTDHDVEDFFECPHGSDFAIGVMNVGFDDGFYMKRLSRNRIVISLFGINDILNQKSISIENFILKQIYEICALCFLFDDIATDDVYHVVHKETRGCLFDLNGYRPDIIHNTENPKICNRCLTAFDDSLIDPDLLNKLQNELSRLKKPFIVTIELLIKKCPLLSVLLLFIFGLCINYVYDLIK